MGHVRRHNYRRYHKALGNMTPTDVLLGRREAILAGRKEVLRLTAKQHKLYNQVPREFLKPGASLHRRNPFSCFVVPVPTGMRGFAAVLHLSACSCALV